MVTPQERRSLTRSTDETTSRAKSSKTSTFHMGSPVSERMGVFAGCRALLPSSASEGWRGALRFRMRWMEAIWRSRRVAMVRGRALHVRAARRRAEGAFTAQTLAAW
jgi:hypothetical protein